MTFTMDLQFKYKCVATPDKTNGQESEFSLVVNRNTTGLCEIFLMRSFITLTFIANVV